MSRRYAVFHALAVKKQATAAECARLANLPPDEVLAVLQTAASTGRALERNGKFVLTPLARIAVESDYSLAFAQLRGTAAFIDAYEQFERLNLKLKALITDWQTVESGSARIVNDHSDRDYDWAIIDRLAELHERADEVLARLEAKLARFSYYRASLQTALQNAENGDLDYVSGARVESYHTVWFELHEDLLRILGRRRIE